MKYIFILGITQRSGTNFLEKILREHPDCDKSYGPPEDFLIQHAYHLSRYANQISKNWLPSWGDISKYKEDLLVSIGRGLLDYLASPNHVTHTVCKTPSSINIHLFPKIFPQEKLIILIRKGPDLIESGIRSRFWSFEEGCIRYNKRAKEIIQYISDENNYLLVKYEELIRNFEIEIQRIFEYCELDIKKVDVAKLKDLPVYGSSQLKSNLERPTWKPIKKSKDFNPLDRKINWSIFHKARFNWICGRIHKSLGYKNFEIRNCSLTNMITLLIIIIRFPLSTYYRLKFYYKKFC